VTPIAVSDEISDFLRPVVKEGMTQTCRDMCSQLCRDAYELAILMRGATDLWEVFYPTDPVFQTGSERDRWIEEESNEKAENRPYSLAYFLSPALAKRPDDNFNVRIPMVKAKAVFFKPN